MKQAARAYSPPRISENAFPDSVPARARETYFTSINHLTFRLAQYKGTLRIVPLKSQELYFVPPRLKVTPA